MRPLAFVNSQVQASAPGQMLDRLPLSVTDRPSGYVWIVSPVEPRWCELRFVMSFRPQLLYVVSQLRCPPTIDATDVSL